MKTKFAFFDMDKTLFKGDSLLPFFRYGLKKRPLCALWVPLMVLATPLMAAHILPIEWFKSMFYSPVSAMNETDFEEFFNRTMLKRRIPKSWETLLQAKADGYHVLIVSASAESYIRPLHTRGLCDGLIGSPLKIKANGRFSPLPAGKNCAGAEKVRRIEDYCRAHGLAIDFDHSIAFSDSDRDRPMMALAATRTRVTKDGRHIPYVTK